MKFRTRLGFTVLEARDVPDGTLQESPTMEDPSTEDTEPGIYDPGTGSGIDPGQGPIGGGDTWEAPPPP